MSNELAGLNAASEGMWRPNATAELRVHEVAATAELVAAAGDAGARRIVVRGNLRGSPAIRLMPGQALCGGGPDCSISFADDGDGVQLSTDNEISSLRLAAPPSRRAIFNDTEAVSLGRIRIADVSVLGQVQILAREAVRSGHVEVQRLHVEYCDTRDRGERPRGFGVSVLQGAFTIWNMQIDERVVISANLIDLSAGREGAPVRGSGIFVSGAGFGGGRLVASRLVTGPVYTDGGIAPGTSDQISGGVFTVFSAHVEEVCNRGPVVTYGPNDMVLDNWGFVDRWTAEQKLSSYGPSAIGFVNFNIVNELKVLAPIETFGRGARGFNVYAGTVGSAEFDRVVTRADGAVGIQVSQPIGRLVVHRGVETFGGTGDSLVKGVVMQLPALPLSVKPGGSVQSIEIDGGVISHGDGVAPFELHGAVGALRISGGCSAAGRGFEKL